MTSIRHTSIRLVPHNRTMQRCKLQLDDALGPLDYIIRQGDNSLCN